MATTVESYENVGSLQTVDQDAMNVDGDLCRPVVFMLHLRMAASVNNASHGNTGHLIDERHELKQTLNMNAVRYACFWDHEILTVYRWVAAEVLVSRTWGDFKQCRCERVGDVDTPVLTAWARGLFQDRFLYWLLGVARFSVLDDLAAFIWISNSDCALKPKLVKFAYTCSAQYFQMFCST